MVAAPDATLIEFRNANVTETERTDGSSGVVRPQRHGLFRRARRHEPSRRTDGVGGQSRDTRAILDAVVDSIITIDDSFRVLDVSPVPTESTAFRTTSDEVRTRSTLSCPMTAITSQRSATSLPRLKMGRSRVIASERTTSTAQR